jgi:ABC-type phosphate transport system permease subunit
VLADFLTSSHAGAALQFYNGTFLVMAILFHTLWRYASRDARLFAADADPATIAAINRAFRYGPFMYGAAFLLAVVSVPLGLAISIGLAIYYSAYSRSPESQNE